MILLQHLFLERTILGFGILLPLLVQEGGHRDLQIELEAVRLLDEVVDQSLGCALLGRLRLAIG